MDKHSLMSNSIICSYLAQLISSAANQYLTNCKNHVVTDIRSRITKWIQYKLTWIPFSKKNLRTSVNHLYRILYSGERLSFPSFFFDIEDPSLFDIASSRFTYILQKARNLLGNLSLEIKEVKKKLVEIPSISTFFINCRSANEPELGRIGGAKM